MLVKRLVFPHKKEVKVETVNILGKLKSTEILIRNVKTFVSAGTELSIYLGIHTGLKDPKNKWAEYPFYPGYSAAGVVEAVGNSIKDIKPGDRVVSESAHESYSIVDISSHSTLSIPEGMSFTQASFFKLGDIALNGIRRAKIGLGDSVVIIGQGIIGQLTLQLAKLSGAGLIIAVDTISQRLEISRKVGADYILNPLRVDIQKKVDKITNGKKAQVIVEATGNPKVIPETFKLVRREGKVILLGSPRGTVELDLYTEVHRYGISLIGAHVATSPSIETDSNPWTIINNQKFILELIRRNSLQIEPLITHEREPNEAEQIYKGLANEKEKFLGVVFDWSTEQNRDK